jgi:superfamily II DNA or RNA helicase
MVINKLSLSFFTKHLGIDSFELAKASYREIAKDGHFEPEISDKKLASILFSNTIKDDFFEKKSNLIDFVSSLPLLSQERILIDLEIENLNKLKWNQKTSNYFINELNLDKKFRLRKNIEKKDSEGFFSFDKPNTTFKKLKRYQSTVFFNVYDYILKTPFARCIIQMPTGSGKTRTAMEIVCDIINDKGKDVLWLANTEELCDQAYYSFIETWYFLRKKSANAVNHLRIKDLPDSTHGKPCFHVATIQSFNSGKVDQQLKKYKINNLELLIVDEAHISIAPTYKKAIDNILQNGAKLIGLTATPGRQLNSNEKSKKENNELSEFYYNKKFEINTGDILPIEFLRNEGILSNAKFISIEGTKIQSILSTSEVKNCIRSNKIPKKIIDILINDKKRTALIFDQLIQLLAMNKKVLFFGTSIKHSKLISTLINTKGYKSAHIDGNSGKYRKDIIEAFKEGEIQLLCNYGVLSTGFDDPKIDVVFMARPTNSIVLYSQIIGRGLRGPKIGGTDTSEIYTVEDNISDLPDNNEIYTYFDEYFVN